MLNCDIKLLLSNWVTKDKHVGWGRNDDASGYFFWTGSVLQVFFFALTPAIMWQE